MKIQILGTGCPKCVKLYELAEKAVAETGVKAELSKVTKIQDIVALGVMMTPALVIDGKIRSSGKIPTKDEIVKMFKEA